MIFVFAYDRNGQTKLNDERFEESNERRATLVRETLEKQYAGKDSIEVVLLRSPDEATLRKTHSRYFLTSREIGNSIPQGI